MSLLKTEFKANLTSEKEENKIKTDVGLNYMILRQGVRIN